MKKKIWVLTLYPNYFTPLQEEGVISRAFSEEGPFELELVQIRDYALDKHGSVDDYIYGGGPGMLMRADVLKNALVNGVLKPSGKKIEELKQFFHIIYPSPRGQRLRANELADFVQKFETDKELVFICGRFEGVDQRFIDQYVDTEISLGDFVLSGGELAVMSIIDATVRLYPGVLGNSDSLSQESFSDGLLEGHHYTRPIEFDGQKVPDVFLSGHHKMIDDYRANEAWRITKERRRDLLEKRQ